MAPVSPKPQSDRTLADGVSEADAVRPIPFEQDAKDGPGEGGRGDEPPDAAELAGTKRKSGGRSGERSTPGVTPVDELNGENDDGVS